MLNRAAQPQPSSLSMYDRRRGICLWFYLSQNQIEIERSKVPLRGPKGPGASRRPAYMLVFINLSMVDLCSIRESEDLLLGNGTTWINAYSMRNIFMVQLPALTWLWRIYNSYGLAWFPSLYWRKGAACQGQLAGQRNSPSRTRRACLAFSEPIL